MERRRESRTTIRELAEYTGLSPAAVSYALRGLQVSAETERRVREAAAELGYEADPIARALAGGATAVVGLLVGSLSDFWNQELVRAVQRQLYGSGRSTLVADADGEPARELELAERLVGQRVDGLVVVPIGPASGGWAAIARQVATVTIGDALPGVEPAGEVVFDNERGVQQSLQHLSDLGHTRVTVLSWAVETSPDRQAERAVAGTAAALGIECDVVPCAYSLNGSRPLAVELLAGAGPPDRDPLHVRLDRLRRLRRVHGARALDPRRRRGRGLRRPPDLATALASADLDGVGRRAGGEDGHRLPAPGDQRRGPAGDAARRRRAGARGASLDGRRRVRGVIRP